MSAIPWREHAGQMSKVCQRLHREILRQTFLVTKHAGPLFTSVHNVEQEKLLSSHVPPLRCSPGTTSPHKP